MSQNTAEFQKNFDRKFEYNQPDSANRKIDAAKFSFRAGG